MDEAASMELMESHLETMTRLAASPYDLALHHQHLILSKQLGVEETEQARELMVQYHPLSEKEWLEWIEERKALLPSSDSDDMTPFVALIELYKRSFSEDLSITLLESYLSYFIASYYTAAGLIPPPSAEEEEEEDEAMAVAGEAGKENLVLSVIFSIDEVRATINEVLEVGAWHIVESYRLWNLARDFEMGVLKAKRSVEQFTRVQDLFVNRLKVPHANCEATFSAYSRLITTYDNANYDTALPAANKVYNIAKTLMIARESKEAELKKSKYYDWAYQKYLLWELGVKRPNFNLVKILFERAVHDVPKSVELWDSYLEYMNGLAGKQPAITGIADRALRHLPASGILWSSYLRCVEKLKLGATAVEGVFARALATTLLNDKPEELIRIYESRADFHRREVDGIIQGAEDLEAEMIDPVVEVLQEGIEHVATVMQGGDPQLRLEKYLLRMFERFNRLEEAGAMWEDLVASRSNSYAVWYGQADFETRAGDFVRAHEVYSKGCATKSLDYPEYLLEAWLTFEHQNGTLANLESTISKVKMQRKGLEARRRREAKQAAAALAPPVPEPSTEMMVDTDATTATETGESKKRERDDAIVEVPAAPAKKAKLESVVGEEPKRDRENSTIFVISPLDAEMTEAALAKLFRDCGVIRECKIKTIGEESIAMIEFMSKDAVPGAQTKDKKRINEVEIDVHLAWQSCLYVTNFPESFDKAAMEKLFSTYGVIFDSRWPSKKYKSTRRFCYVQFTSPASAQAALQLHDQEIAPGSKLSVFISDPGRKQVRSDAHGNNRELFIGGLPKSTKEDELRKLFEVYGTIKGIRILLDDKGACRGSAFVDFEDEATAQASLALNNLEFKKRRISVTIAQSRVVGAQQPSNAAKEGKVELAGRTLVVRNIPVGTQEAVVQQTFEKVASVKCVLMDEGATEARIEFESAAEAGKVLLMGPTLKIDEAVLDVSSLTFGMKARPGAKKAFDPTAASIVASTSTGGLAMMPRQAGRGRGRGGRGGRGGIGSMSRSSVASGSGTALSAATPPAATKGTGATQDDFRAMLNR